MTSYATYSLYPDGTVPRWLACGTVSTPIADVLAQVVPPTGDPFGEGHRWIVNFWAFDPESAAIKQAVYQKLPPFTWAPGEPPILHSPGIGGLRWEFAEVLEDQVVDFSRFNFAPALMQGWTYAGIEAEIPVTLDADLITIGPARLWLNGQLVRHYSEHFSYVAVQRIPVRLALQAGINHIYLAGEMLGWREARLALGLRFRNAPPLRVKIPIGEILAESWHRAEAGLHAMQLRQFAVPALPARISLATAAPSPFAATIEIGTPQPDRFWLADDKGYGVNERHTVTLNPGEHFDLPLTPDLLQAMARTPGEHALHLTIRPADGTPIHITRELWASAVPFSTAPYGTYESRRAEALAHLAAMPYDVLTSMAALMLGNIQQVSSQVVAGACRFLNNRYDCADFYAIGLLALLYRYGNSPALRAEDQAQIEAVFLNFKFWIDEPGIDAMCYFTENHQILFHVAAYLTGQYFPARVFSNSGYTGVEQQQRNQPRIEAWILRRLRGNFSEWDSNAYMALDIFAMLALVEFAEDDHLRQMATAMLDKVFFLIACQSYRGAHASTHGRCYVSGLKSARAENTSSIQRIGWGMGIFNGETRAAGLLALSRHYQLPEVIQRIGADVSDVLTTRVRSRAEYDPKSDMKPGTWDICTITRRTPDGMLAAAVDYRPGTMGIQEHLCQITLSPDAVIFTTYPGNSQEHGNARPNFWAGSVRLPRVQMYERTALCLYKLEPGAGLGFTHAYFPVVMFDETALRGNWAFARFGDGYAALWGDGELILTQTGEHIGQELRSRGEGLAWIFVLGRKSEDGSFSAFMDRLLQTQPVAAGSSVQWRTPEGTQLDFGWKAPFRVNGQPVSVDNFPHYENRYTHTALDASLMTIQHGGLTLTLDLQHGRRIE